MPEYSCLFGVATPVILEALNADPSCAGRVHRLEMCEGIELGGLSLAVVQLRGSTGPPWGELAGRRWPLAPAGLLVPPTADFRWLDGALPPSDVVQRWASLSRKIGRPLAWWWWWERGDNLYADAAWLLGPGPQALAVRETPLVSGRPADLGLIFRAGEAPVPLEEAPLQLALAQLGFETSLQYFAPTDHSAYDWEKHRV